MDVLHTDVVCAMVGFWLVRPRDVKFNWRTAVALLLLALAWIMFCLRIHPAFQH